MQNTPATYANPVIAVASGTYTSTQTSAAIDTAIGFSNLAIVVNAGTFGASATCDVKVQECATSGGTYADISGATFTQITASNDETAYCGSIALGGARLRYIKVVATYGGTGNVLIGATALFLGPNDSVRASSSFSV